MGMVIGLGQGTAYIAPQDSLDGIAKVIYESKDAKTHKTFDALDWPRKGRRDANTNTIDNPHPQ